MKHLDSSSYPPTTTGNILRRSIALVIDDTFILGVPLNRIDLDALVERLALEAERVVGNTPDQIKAESRDYVDKMWAETYAAVKVVDRL